MNIHKNRRILFSIFPLVLRFDAPLAPSSRACSHDDLQKDGGHLLQEEELLRCALHGPAGDQSIDERLDQRVVARDKLRHELQQGGVVAHDDFKGRFVEWEQGIFYLRDVK